MWSGEGGRGRGAILAPAHGVFPKGIPMTWEPASVSVRLSLPVRPKKTEQGEVGKGAGATRVQLGIVCGLSRHDSPSSSGQCYYA